MYLSCLDFYFFDNDVKIITITVYYDLRKNLEKNTEPG